MEKVIAVLMRPEPDDDWCARQRAQVADALLGLGVAGLSINVRDSTVRDSLMTLTTLYPPVAAVVSLWTQQCYGEQVAAALRLLAQECDELGAYLVTESVPLTFPSLVESGSRTPGLANIALLRRPDGLDQATWLTRWQRDHTQVAIEAQATFGYTQNWVVRALTPEAPGIAGIVEELFPVAATTDLKAFFGAADDNDLQSLYLVVLGAGIGLSMQVLVLIVQNTSSFEDLGVATSGVTFFRVVGASFGTATFGALFVNFLDRRLGSALTSGAVPVPAVPSPAVLHQLPQSMAAPIVRAYAESLTQVFLCAVSVTVVGFILALLLREVPLTDIHDDADDLGDGFGVPRAESPEDVLEIAVRRMLPNGVRLRDIATQPGCGLGVAELWALLRIYQYQRLFEAVRLTDIGRHLHVPYQVFEPVFDRLVQTGYAARDGDILTLTPSGHRQVDSLAVLIRQWLLDHLAVAPGLKRQPDHQFEAALQHVTDAVLVQRDWYEDLGDLSESRQLAATT